MRKSILIRFAENNPRDQRINAELDRLADQDSSISEWIKDTLYNSLQSDNDEVLQAIIELKKLLKNGVIVANEPGAGAVDEDLFAGLRDFAT